MTYYQAVVGAGAAFHIQNGVSIKKFLDGTSNTVLVLETRNSVPWTQPVDLSIASGTAALIPQLKNDRHSGMFHALFADGSVRLLPDSISPNQLKAFMTINGGEVVQ